MLRIMISPATPDDMPHKDAKDMPPDEPMSEEGEQEKVSQATVVYMTSDKGPFTCDNCYFWHDPNACKIVEGVIDPKGCCNLYESSQDQDGAEEESPEEDGDEPMDEPPDTVHAPSTPPKRTTPAQKIGL